MRSLDCFKGILKDRDPSNLSVENINAELMDRNWSGVIFLAILLVIGVFGNVTVLLTYGLKFKRGTNYRFYVLFLALLDTGNCIIGIPWCLVYMLRPLTFPSDVFCRGGLFVSFVLSVTGAGGLVLIAFDRYRKICCPLKKQINIKNAKRSVVVIIVISILSTWFTPFLYELNKLPLSSSGEKGYKCYLATNPIANFLSKGFYIILAMMFLTISATLTILYYFIMRKVQTHSKSFNQKSKSNNNDTFGRRTSNLHTRKTTLTFLMITTVYILTTLPHIVGGLVFHFDEYLECRMSSTTHNVFYFFYWTVYINNVANPFIYGLSDERFRGIIRYVITYAVFAPFKASKKRLPSASFSVSIDNNDQKIQIEAKDDINNKTADAISVVSEEFANKLNGDDIDSIRETNTEQVTKQIHSSKG
ncbi:trace amine-associated receptor 3-like [Saccostrea echinata]|uniref:trace amine-associated receptor 3-like n=1 Tax=Saccostrea echinata TaxID=191078 RepID=UPI002A7FDDF9|nr:trace amine-associated receptor 3-like [Saccostrea echinata]